MKKLGLALLFLGLSSCATLQKERAQDCDPQASYQSGLRDGEQGKVQPDFASTCSDSSSALALKKYREGLNAARARSKKKTTLESHEGQTADVARVVQTLDTSSWICEVEASTKIFTGVGASQEEAVRSAKSTCGSHFQASFCSEAHCKQSL